MSYNPERWVILCLTPKGEQPIYKVFAGWYGSYTTGASWKLNSGIEKVTKTKGNYSILGSSGSIYDCATACEGMSGYMMQVLDGLKQQYKDIATIDIIPMKKYRKETNATTETL